MSSEVPCTSADLAWARRITEYAIKDGDAETIEYSLNLYEKVAVANGRASAGAIS